LNELLYLRFAEGARRFVFMGRHEYPHIVSQQRFARSKQTQLGSFGPKGNFVFQSRDRDAVSG
jgi:hypothetical protein